MWHEGPVLGICNSRPVCTVVQSRSVRTVHGVQCALVVLVKVVQVSKADLDERSVLSAWECESLVDLSSQPTLDEV